MNTLRNRRLVATVENELDEEACQIRSQGDPLLDGGSIRFAADGL